MRIGFASIYSWRPHVEHLTFLAQMMSDAGHNVEFLICNSDLPTCYTRELRNTRAAWQECLYCKLGNFRSYYTDNVSSIGEFNTPSPLPKDIGNWTQSSASTLKRFESNDDYLSNEFKELAYRLQPSIEKTYQSASKWITTKKLDAVIVFNGRMDVTRAIFEASVTHKIPVVSVERTWFGNGLQILPGENCLGLKSVNKIISDWAHKALTIEQAKKAGNLMASRITNSNSTEWRTYNKFSAHTEWPIKDHHSHKILLTPGSLNEIWGHPDWENSWNHPTDAYDAIITHLELVPSDLLLRCHPNWSEKIGNTTGLRSENVYTEWAKQRGILVIPSDSNISTFGLIEQADAIILSSGSSSLEAGALGKQVISTAPSIFQKAGFQDKVYSPNELKGLKLNTKLDKKDALLKENHIRRQTLRFTYNYNYRVQQYVSFIKAISTTEYKYRKDANPDKLIHIIEKQAIEPDDKEFTIDETSENEILEFIKRKEWGKLIFEDSLQNTQYFTINRRQPYKNLDLVRKWMKHGDR